jgi:hypothetical protein
MANHGIVTDLSSADVVEIKQFLTHVRYEEGYAKPGLSLANGSLLGMPRELATRRAK